MRGGSLDSSGESSSSSSLPSWKVGFCFLGGVE